MNNFKVSAISQGLDENTTTFLKRLREAFIKYTNLDLESHEGQLILKDKFLTKSASDIRKNLQKLTQEPRVSLDEMLTMSMQSFTTGTRGGRTGLRKRKKGRSF